jgi:hypothetical protein
MHKMMKDTRKIPLDPPFPKGESYGEHFPDVEDLGGPFPREESYVKAPWLHLNYLFLDVTGVNL